MVVEPIALPLLEMRLDVVTEVSGVAVDVGLPVVLLEVGGVAKLKSPDATVGKPSRSTTPNTSSLAPSILMSPLSKMLYILPAFLAAPKTSPVDKSSNIPRPPSSIPPWPNIDEFDPG